MYSDKNRVSLNRKMVIVCLVIILIAIVAANLWRLNPQDRDAMRAVSIYTEILKETRIIGENYTEELTTTLGYYPAKMVSEDPIAAALMVRLLKEAGVTKNSVIAINASGSFPGFTLAALAACAALDLETYIIASIGSSTYGANIPGNTIADMLLQENVRSLGHTLLAITPGGGRDMGLNLDENELRRIAEMVQREGIPYIVPDGTLDAIAIRESMFIDKGSTLLMNVGGNHASTGGNLELNLMAGIIWPDEVNSFDDPGLIQSFLNRKIPVIQVLNVRLLYSSYGLEFDQEGRILGNSQLLLSPTSTSR